jgi:hypothetical protein
VDSVATDPNLFLIGVNSGVGLYPARWECHGAECLSATLRDPHAMNSRGLCCAVFADAGALQDHYESAHETYRRLPDKDGLRLTSVCCGTFHASRNKVFGHLCCYQNALVEELYGAHLPGRVAQEQPEACLWTAFDAPPGGRWLPGAPGGEGFDESDTSRMVSEGHGMGGFAVGWEGRHEPRQQSSVLVECLQ